MSRSQRSGKPVRIFPEAGGRKMKVDPKAEFLGRSAVVAALSRERDRFSSALDAIAAADPRVSQQIIPIYAAVAQAALLAIHNGQLPNVDQVREMAAEV